MPKITIIGGGSRIFARSVIRDSLALPALRDSTFCLMDIDSEALGYMETIAGRMIEQAQADAVVEVTTEREAALRGADYVVVSILVGGYEPIRAEIDIPLKYGVEQCIGDTMGPGGIFRACRTVPVLVDIARDVEELCPDAYVLNYTNPMSMCCEGVRRETDVKLVGLCHSVQGAHEELAEIIGEDPSHCSSWVAGINHTAWVLQYTCRGEDAYPRIREAARTNEEWRRDNRTRVEMLRRLDYYVTESSGHNSEYNPWFRKRPDLLEKFAGEGFNGETGYVKKLYSTRRGVHMGQMREAAEQAEPYDMTPSHEYGAFIINALETGEPFRFNGTVENAALITNLPEGCSVEVPCFADKAGIHPCHVGKLPPQLAALNNMQVNSVQMGLRAALTGDKDLLYWAIAYDPLTAAVLSMAEIEQMVDEMYEAEKSLMPRFGG